MGLAQRRLPGLELLRRAGRLRPALFYDKEQITVDNNPSSPYYGRIYVTYVKFHIQPDGFTDYCPAQVAYTDNIDPNGDGDLTDAAWQQQRVVPDNPGGNGKGPSANQGAQPVVDDQGGLDISYMTEECNSSIDHKLLIRRSTNGGVTFGPAVRINKPGEWADNPNPDDVLRPSSRGCRRRPPRRWSSTRSTTRSTTSSRTTSIATRLGRRHLVRQVARLRQDLVGHDHCVGHTDRGSRRATTSSSPGWTSTQAASSTRSGSTTGRRQELLHRDLPGRAGIDGGRCGDNKDIATQVVEPEQKLLRLGRLLRRLQRFAAGNGVMYPLWTDGRNTPGPPLGQTDIWTNVELNSFP